MLPVAGASRPEASSIAAVASVTLVLPFVPVTAATGLVTDRQASSISLHIGTPDSRDSTMGRERSEKPGLATTRSIPDRIAGSQSPVADPKPSASGPSVSTWS